jgi:hypothetical protein
MTDRPLQAGEQAAKRRGEPQERALGRRTARLVGAALVVAMVLGALFMWIGVPVVWLWLASQLAENSKPHAGLYVFAGVGILLSMAGMGWLLARLNRMHVEFTGRSRGSFVRRGWLRSEHGEQGLAPSAGVLDTIVVVSVVIAVLVFLVWFFFFAGSSINYQN